VRDLTLHDHLCWVYGDPADLSPSLVGFVHDGLVRGQRVRYVGNGEPEQLREDLTGLADLDRLLDIGAVEITSVTQSYQRDGPGVAAVAQADSFTAATVAAVDEGYTGLRVAAECTTLIESPRQRDAFARYEILLDRTCVANPLTAMCAFDGSRVDSAEIAELAMVHPLARARATSVHLFAQAGVDLALAGDVEKADVPLFETALERVASPVGGGGEIVVDVGEVTFISHHGLGAIDRWAARRGVSVRLVNATTVMARVALLIGLENLRVQTR